MAKLKSLIGQWVISTPGGTLLLYSADSSPLFANNRARAIAKVLADMQYIYPSWEALAKRGYTIEQIQENSKESTKQYRW